MAATGSVFESRGTWFARVSLGGGKRPAVRLPTCTSEKQARARATLAAALVADLRKANQDAFIDPTLRQVAEAPEDRLPEIARYVRKHLCSGDFVRADAPPELGAKTTFQVFAEEWTSGKLHERFPDYVPKKGTAEDDAWRLAKHVYPVVGPVPLRAFTLAHAKETMRRLPSSLSPASRRHVAQLIRRVLTLAVWPAEIVPSVVVPKGFLPKLGAPKAMAVPYPNEEAAMLACSKTPLVWRLFFGLSAREGGRRGEFAALRWRDLDLERGVVRVDRPKEGRPKAWDLAPGTTLALKRWYDLQGKPAAGDLVFKSPKGKRLNVEHAADRLREAFEAAGVDREELYESTGERRALRAHDLRAFFVTQAVAAGRDVFWITDRTGHTTLGMVMRYRRVARIWTATDVGQVADLAAAIPELSAESVSGKNAKAKKTSAKVKNRK